MEYWELVLIERGYNRRNILTHQLLRIAAYGSFHCMAGDHEGKGPEGWLPLYFDKYKDLDDEEPLSDNEIDDMLNDIKAINEAHP